MTAEALGSMKVSNMIALAGEQPMPNILAALHFTPRKMYLLASEHPRVESAAQRTAAVVKECGIGTELVSGVPAYDAPAVHRLCSRILANGKDFLVNLTGGTKLQALGAFSAARDSGTPSAYLEFRDKSVHVFNGMETGETPIRPEVFELIDVRRCLLAHGVETGREERSKNLHQLFKRSSYLADEIRDIQWMAVKLRHGWHTKGWSDLSLRGSSAGVLRRLAEWGYIEGDVGARAARVRFTEAGRAFVGGTWLEYFAAFHLTPLKPDDLAFRVPIRVVVGNRDIRTELDVAVTIKARLFVVSCKTASLSSRKDPDSYVDHLDELRALSPILGGTFGRSVLVTSENFAKKAANRVLDRAAVYGIPVLDRSSFPQLTERFRAILK